jgi:hypothetical protein
LIVLDGLPADHETSVRVWRAANIARLLPPSAERVARVWQKLADPGACLVIGHPIRAATCWPWHWLNPVARRTAQAPSSRLRPRVHCLRPPRHVGPGSRPTAAARTPRARNGQRLGTHDTVDQGIERSRWSPLRSRRIPNPQADRTPLATVTSSSSSSVKHADPQAPGKGSRPLAGQLLAGRRRCSRIEGNAGSPEPADWYMPAPSGVALSPRHAHPCRCRTS